MKRLTLFLLCCGLLLLPTLVFAQESLSVNHVNDSLFIEKVNIYGNRVTKRFIILRELRYKEGSKIQTTQIDSLLSKEREKILNTDLFSSVEIDYRRKKELSDTIQLDISLQELWFSWPVPIFETSDRSFSEWVNNRGADLNRINYGFRYRQRNIRGRRETLGLTAIFGFERQFSVEYQFPFIDKKLRTSLSIAARYEDNNTIGYITSNHLFVEASSPDIEGERRRPISTRQSIGFRLGKRYQFYGSHRLEFFYENNQVSDTIAFLNPNFYLEGRTQQRLFRLRYRYDYDRRDFSRYALKGYVFRFAAERLGLGIFNEINLTRFDVTFAKYFNLGEKFYALSGVSGKVSFPSLQPYLSSRALGYRGMIIRGLDNYVVEGQHIFTLSSELKYKVLERTFDISKIIPFAQFNKVPVEIFPKVFADVGYIHNPVATFDNRALTNKPVWGIGVGIDVIVLKSAVLRFEYSFSFQGEHGFFFDNSSVIR